MGFSITAWEAIGLFVMYVYAPVQIVRMIVYYFFLRKKTIIKPFSLSVNNKTLGLNTGPFFVSFILSAISVVTLFAFILIFIIFRDLGRYTEKFAVVAVLLLIPGIIYLEFKYLHKRLMEGHSALKIYLTVFGVSILASGVLFLVIFNFILPFYI